MLDENFMDFDADYVTDDTNSEDYSEDNFRDDVEADADVLRMAGYGTDEDYNCYDDCDSGDPYDCEYDR